MSVSIQLNSAMQANLVALQATSKLMGITQQRLATGKRVNSAVDDAQSYFSARQGTDKANALSSLKLDMGEGLQKVKSGLTAIDSALDVLNQMKGLANQAKATSDATTRSDLAAQYNDLKTQYESILSKDANYKGTNLLAANNNLTIQFNEDNTSNLTINSVETTGTNAAVNGTSGYDPSNAAGNWANDTDISNSLADVGTAIKNLTSLSTKLASFSSFIQTRMDFTTSMVDINKEGSNNLTNADMNEESANMLTLQTRQQLAINSLSISNQAAQSILNLF